MGLEYDPWTGEYVETETPAPAAEPAITPDPLATLGAGTPTPVPGVTPEGSQTATATPVQPNLDPLAENRVIKGVNATARALAMPVTNPKAVAQGLANEVNDAIIGAAEGVTGEPNELLRRNLNPNYQAPEHLGEAPIARLVPFVKTSGDIVTPEGREELAQHPEQVALDVLGVLPTGALGRSAKVVPKAAEKAGSLLEKTAPGRAVVEKVSRATGKVREGVIPSPRMESVQALPQAQRAAAQQVQRNIGSLLDDLQKADLTPEQATLLRESTDRGIRPADEKIAPIYDAIKEHSEADRLRKMQRDIPDEMKSVVVDQVEATLGPKMAATGLGPERSAVIFDAIRKGADNPIPEASKAWKSANLEVNRRVLARTRDAKLFEFDPKLPGVAPQVYPWREYTQLRRAQRMLDRKLKVLDPELHPAAHAGYRAIVEKYTPGKYEAAMHQQKAALALAQNRQRFEPGFGRVAYDQMAKESSQTWLDLAEQGVDPVYVPREALRTLTDDVVDGRPQLTTRKPGSMKSSGGVADYYETDPAVMLVKNEYELANQTMVQKAIAETYRKTGGRSYERALRDYLDRGYSQAQAERMIRSNYASMALDGKTSRAMPGNLLVRRDVAAALKTYVEKTMPSLVDEMFGAWMVPTLWLAPMFHVNNVAGGVLMVGLKSPGSLLDYLAYGREAWRTVREGRMDSRVPFGAGMAPQYTRKFTRESRLAEGGRLASIWEKIPGHGVVDKARRFNEFVDSVNRTIMQMSEYDRAIAKGVDTWTARETAGKAAANLMQNWDSFTPIERAIVQRVYPFWGFRKAMLKTVMTYPIDHPIRMQFLYQLSRDQQEREDLPNDWDHLLGISGEGEDGKRYYLSIKGLDPFADINDFFSFKGFLQNLSPIARPGYDIAGVDSYRGGVPYWAPGSQGADIDLDTGLLKRPMSWGDLWNFVPQVGAAATALGLKDLPPPDEDTPEGWTRWLDTYGSMLRITPGIRRTSEAEAAATFAENLKTQQRLNASAEKQKESAAPPNIAAKAPATTPGPTPEPAGVSYNPWTGEYE